MAFPPVIIECAFNSLLSEDASAQSGYTEITKYVETISGTLRGRAYELDDVETGSITLGLDNSDNRFTPDSPVSPYYPYVKANRRLRIRGTNMQRLNIARAGGQTFDTDGFFKDANFVLDATDGVTPVVLDPVLMTHSPVALGFDGELLNEPYHIEATIKAGATAGTYRVLSYWCPVELGVRSTHSAYVWKVSGTEPSGTLIYVVNSYYDATGTEIEKDPGDSNFEWNRPTPASPTRRVFGDLPPGDTAYMIQSIAIITTSTLTTDITYAVNGIQSEIPTANLVPSISGYYDVAAWQFNATGDTDPGTVATGGTGWSDAYVLATVGTDSVELYTTVPHIAPGDYYTFVAEVKKSGGPDLMLSGDDGQSGVTLTANNVWTTLRHTFLATHTEQQIKLIPQGAVVDGTVISVRLAKCTYQNDSLPLASTATDTDETEWQHPIPVFEGLVERWPVKTTASASTITITVNDRLKAIGDQVMESTLKQTIITDSPDLLIPMTDQPEDSKGVVSVLGDWMDEADTSQVTSSQTKYGPGAATFTLGGLVGPTDEDAVKLTQVSSTQGYVLLVPYSYDYTSTPAPPVFASPPVPSPYSKGYYHRTYYATWTQSYDSTNARRTSPYLYQGVSGFAGESYGNQKGLIGFNWSAIKADLKDFTVKHPKTKKTTKMHVTVTDVQVSLFAIDWGLYLSGTGYIGWHNYGSAPSTWADVNVAQRLATVTKWPRDAWRTIKLGPKVAQYFQAGTARGFAVGPGNGDKASYGTWYGATAGKFRPFLTISYRVTPVK